MHSVNGEKSEIFLKTKFKRGIFNNGGVFIVKNRDAMIDVLFSFKLEG